MAWQLRGRTLSLDKPLIMGVVNVTPDSFSDGGLYYSVENAVRHARTLAKEGADIIDIGGESTRPQGATPVHALDEVNRVVPVIALVAEELPDVVISVDTVKSDVAREAIKAGAHIVNDVSGFRLDALMAAVCVESGAGVILMHSRGDVTDMATYARAEYAGDAVGEILAELRACVDAALAAGVARECLAVDPGIGFSKRSEHSLRMLGCLHEMTQWELPIVVGVSRKRFIGDLTGRSVANERVFGSIGAAVSAYDRGARVFRVHDVAATREALDVAAAIHAAGRDNADSSTSRGMSPC